LEGRLKFRLRSLPGAAPYPMGRAHGLSEFERPLVRLTPDDYGTLGDVSNRFIPAFPCKSYRAIGGAP